ncbi:hypothetical protein N7492_007987 [Penicillium capsulatum]|uniref:Uncharacterized protein n=1 Tax=Penicillium capsulatum TaxID=69766 RepID=A0A9W9HRP2_9EURO|nr:hypothetical protein N7492_007987 [Penicillium capsulatum]KAJ6105394.1 hypothetical protein N7512_008911 [Penicillium capsulatum]
MYFSKTLFLSQVMLAAASCGDADACIGTEVCTTATFTTPTTTTITTCVPTPTCLGVYANCVSGGIVGNCCSGYCAATKCRSTDDKWPSCREDNGPCLADENCCYGNKCVKGLCARP